MSSGCVGECKDELARTLWFVSDNANGYCDNGGGGSSPQCVGCGEGYFDTDLYGNPACVSKAFVKSVMGLVLATQLLHLVHVVVVVGQYYRQIMKDRIVVPVPSASTTSFADARTADRRALTTPQANQQREGGSKRVRSLRKLGSALSVSATLINMVLPIRQLWGHGSLDDGWSWSCVALGFWCNCAVAYTVGLLWCGALPRTLLQSSPKVLHLQQLATQYWYVYAAASTLSWGSGCVWLGFHPTSDTFWKVVACQFPFLWTVVGSIVLACTAMLGLLTPGDMKTGARDYSIDRTLTTSTAGRGCGGEGRPGLPTLSSKSSEVGASSAGRQQQQLTKRVSAEQRHRVVKECHFIRLAAPICGSACMVMTMCFLVEPIKSWGSSRPLLHIVPFVMVCNIWEMLAFSLVMKRGLSLKKGPTGRGGGGAGREGGRGGGEGGEGGAGGEVGEGGEGEETSTSEGKLGIYKLECPDVVD